jgi:hypothetical protein
MAMLFIGGTKEGCRDNFHASAASPARAPSRWASLESNPRNAVEFILIYDFARLFAPIPNS